MSVPGRENAGAPRRDPGHPEFDKRIKTLIIAYKRLPTLRQIVQNTQMQIITFRLESHYVEELKRRGQREERSLFKTIRRILINDLTRPSSPAGQSIRKKPAAAAPLDIRKVFAYNTHNK